MKKKVIDWNVFKNENKDNLTLIYDWVSKNLIKSMSIKNFRSIMYSFLDSGIIDINKYFKMTDSFYIHSLFLNNGEFFGASGQNLIKFTKCIVKQNMVVIKILNFFQIFYMSMVAELQNKNSHWYMFFENVKKNNEKVVLLTTGWRVHHQLPIFYLKFFLKILMFGWL